MRPDVPLLFYSVKCQTILLINGRVLPLDGSTARPLLLISKIILNNILCSRQLENDERATLELTSAKNNNNDTKYPSESAESTDSDISSVEALTDDLQDTPDGFDYAAMELWGEIIRDWEENMKRRPKFVRDLTHQGIPDGCRCIAWQYFTGAWESSLVGKYADLLQVSNTYIIIYCSLTKSLWPKLLP